MSYYQRLLEPVTRAIVQNEDLRIINVSLTPELERFIEGKVLSGLYNNASEVVGEGLRLLKVSHSAPRANFERHNSNLLAGLTPKPGESLTARRQ